MVQDLEGGHRLESQKCQQSAYMWQPWSCISCVAVHRVVGLPLGRTASPRFRDAQWTLGRKSRPLGQYPVTADSIVTSRPALIAAHGHRQQAHKWCMQKFGENCRCVEQLLFWRRCTSASWSALRAGVRKATESYSVTRTLSDNCRLPQLSATMI